MAAKYDVTVVGGGPGGYVAAIRAAQLGLSVALVEKDQLGGLCLNWGCIPSKSLLRNAEVVLLFHRAKEFGIKVDGFQPDMAEAVKRSRRVVDRLVKGVESLMRKNKVTVLHGEGSLQDAHTVHVTGDEEQTVETANIILATGARERTLPFLPVDGESIITSHHALLLDQAPENLVIVGGGPVGVEFASYFSAYGSNVTVLEMMPHILPAEDPEVVDILHKALEKRGIKVLANARVEGLDQSTVKVTKDGGAQQVPYDKLLVAIGFEANTEGLGLEALGIEREGGFVKVDDYMATNVAGIYAIGDLIGQPLLAHVAEAQGVQAAEVIAGRRPGKLDLDNMPRAVYSHPQVASIGITEEQAKERGYEVKVGRFPYRANGKALGLGDYDGLIKMVSDTRTGAILGAQMVGPECSELLGELSVAITLEATPAELGRSVHPHPSLSEVLMEAALGVENESIHI